MAIENTAGLGVNNVYGPRKTAEGRNGNINTAGVVKELELDFRGDSIDFVSATIPAGAKILDAYADVEEVFGGLTDLDVGTDGSEGTNGVDLDPTATGVSDLTPIGTWADVLAASTTVGVAGTGTSDGSGKAKVVIRYVVL